MQRSEQDSLGLSLKADARYKMETRPFVIRSHDIPSGYAYTGGGAEVVESSEDGICIRVFYTLPNGTTIQREFSDPPALCTRVNW